MTAHGFCHFWFRAANMHNHERPECKQSARTKCSHTLLVSRSRCVFQLA